MPQSVQENINQLKEQTNLLLSKQSEAREHSTKLFGEFLALVTEQVEAARGEGKAEDEKKLTTIAGIMKEQSSGFAAEIGEDIAFLEGQLKVLGELESEQDEAKQKEILDMILEDHELIPTAQFKEELEKEAQVSREGFETILTDLKEALLEGDVDELLVYLQEVTKEEGAGQQVTLEGLEEEQEEGFSRSEMSKADDGCCSSALDPQEKTGCCKGALDCGDKCVCDGDCGCEVDA